MRGARSDERRASKQRGGWTVALRSSLLALLLFALSPEIVQGCPVCFGESDSPMAKGTNNAVWVMVGIVGFVQFGFVALFISFWRRARAIRKKREQFHLIEGGIVQ